MTNREQVGKLLVEAHRVTAHKEFVIIGSLSVLGVVPDPPDVMVYSVDVDLYPRLDPGRAGEIMAALGESSEFYSRNGIYADAVSPDLAVLPEGWEKRVHRIEYPEGVVGLYVDPNDVAVSKLARGQPNDIRWVREGLAAGILDADAVSTRMADAPFLDQNEHEHAKALLALEIDRLNESKFEP